MLSAKLVLKLLLNYYPCVLGLRAPLLCLHLKALYVFLLLGDLVLKRLVFQEVLSCHISLLLKLCGDPGKVLALELQVIIQHLFVFYIVRS